MSKHHSNKSRRKFLGQLGCTGLGMTTFLSGITNLGLMNAAAASNMPIYMPPSCSDYKALVCLSLSGGNDSYNMLLPSGTDEYNEYAAVRTNQSLNQADLLGINPNTSDGKEYGLHPNLTNLQSLFENGNAAFIANVGTLVQPTDLSSYGTEQNLPLGLYSHLDQLNHWQTSVPQSRNTIGWCGRLADLLYSVNDNQNISMNITLNGTNIIQRGNVITEYAIDPNNGSVTIWGSDSNDFFNTLKRETLDNMMDQSYQNILKTAYADAINGATNNSLEFSAALASITPLTTVFPDTNIGNRFEMVAKTIAARETLGMCRQTFFVEMGGFDNHDELLNAHGLLMTELDDALNAFWNALVELGLTNDVTTFSISDFARTLTSNGNGTDHGWGGHAFVMGGAVNGQDIYGQYPDIYLENPLDTGDGRIIPTTSCDEYFAELALWFADNGTDTLSATQLTDIFPNITNFWSPSPGAMPLGFLGA